MRWEGSFEGQALGRLLRWFAFFVLVATAAILLFVYLSTVASSPEVLPAANRSTAPLYFVNPIRRFEPRADSIWSTHPPTIDRINRPRALHGEAPLDAAAGTLFEEDTDQPYDPNAERRAGGQPSGLRPAEAERLTQIGSGELPAGRDQG